MTARRTRPARRSQGFVRGLPGIRLWYETVERLAEIQAELRRQNKRLLRLQRPESAIPKSGLPEQDAAFVQCVAAVGGRTKLDRDRLWMLWQAVRNVAHLGLPVLEGGSYRGGSAHFLARAFLEHTGQEVALETIDTFEGHPAEKLTDADHQYHVAGRFSEASFEETEQYLSAFRLSRVHKGEFSAVAPTLSHDRYGLVHVDLDLYLPTMEALRFAGPRVPAGGVIVLDDYGARRCPGVRQAAEEFLSGDPDFHAWHPHTEQLIVVRIR